MDEDIIIRTPVTAEFVKAIKARLGELKWTNIRFAEEIERSGGFLHYFFRNEDAKKTGLYRIRQSLVFKICGVIGLDPQEWLAKLGFQVEEPKKIKSIQAPPRVKALQATKQTSKTVSTLTPERKILLVAAAMQRWVEMEATASEIKEIAGGLLKEI